MKTIDKNLTGYQAYRALVSMAFEHKGYFALAVIGMVIFAASDAGGVMAAHLPNRWYFFCG